MDLQRNKSTSTGAQRGNKEIKTARSTGAATGQAPNKEQEVRNKIAAEENEKFWKRTEFAKERRPDLDKLKEEASALEDAAKKIEDELMKLIDELSLAEDKARHAEGIVQRGEEKEADDLDKRVALLEAKAQEVSKLATAVKKMKDERLTARRLADEARDRFLQQQQRYRSEIKKYAPRDALELLEQYDLAKIAPEETEKTAAGTAEEVEKEHEAGIFESMRALRQLRQAGQETQYQQARKELIDEIINSLGETLEENIQEQLAGQDTWLMLDHFADGQLKSPENVLQMLKKAATKRLDAIRKRQK